MEVGLLPHKNNFSFLNEDHIIARHPVFQQPEIGTHIRRRSIKAAVPSLYAAAPMQALAPSVVHGKIDQRYIGIIGDHRKIIILTVAIWREYIRQPKV